MHHCINYLKVLLFLFATSGAMAQNPASGLEPSNDFAAKKHVGPTGKPCITMFGDSRPQTINPQIFDNVIVATNACGRPIRAKVCYYHSDHCVMIDVAAYSRTAAMLGIMPAMQGFRFEFSELFSPFGPK